MFRTVKRKKPLGGLGASDSAIIADALTSYRARLSEQARLHACDDVAKVTPVLQEEDSTNCVPEIAYYDLPCTADNLKCYIFRYLSFLVVQEQLKDKVKAKPADDATYGEKFDWADKVLRLSLQAYDATNLHPKFIFSQRMKDMMLPYNSSAKSSFYVRSEGLPLSILMMCEGTYANRTAIEREGGFGEFDIVAHANEKLEDKCIFRGYTILQSFEDTWSNYNKTVEAAWTGSNATKTGQLTTVNGEKLRVYKATGETESASFLSAEQRAVYAWQDSWIASWKMQAAYCEAVAKDITDRSFDEICLKGTDEWLKYIKPYVDNGQLDISGEAFAKLQEENARALAQAGGAAFSGTVGGVFALGGVTGAIMGGILSLVLLVFITFAPMASGYACPAPPFRRSLKVTECDIGKLDEGAYKELITVKVPHIEDLIGHNIMNVPEWLQENVPPEMGPSTSITDTLPFKIAVGLAGAVVGMLLVKMAKK